MAAALIAPRHHPFPALAPAPDPAPTTDDRRAAARAAMYRRRRIAAVLAALVALWLVVLVTSWTVSAVSAAVTDVTAGSAPPAAAEPSAQVHTVRAGDSLWSIARDLRPEGDVRPIVDELARRTGGAPLQPGQRIDVHGLG